ncbi:MAG: enoyl-CoA hydratase/isomerase family protein [Burkholderiaceae bacterium]
MSEEAIDGVRIAEIPTASGHRFGHATLDAPASLNSLTLAMVDRLAAQLEAWIADAGIAGIVLDAAGDKAFCAGGDVIALYRSIRSAAPGTVPVEAATFFEREYRLDYRLHTCPKPVLCWGHGIVMGGGIGLLAGASHRVATPKTRLAMPEITIGLYPDVGGSWFLGRAPGRTGLFLALTGAPMNAADARFAGLADFVIAHEDKAAVLQAIAAASWRGSRAADDAALGALLDAHGCPIPESPLRAHYDRIDALVGHDGLAPAMQRIGALAGDPDRWLAQAGEAARRGSPSSAALAWTLQDQARHLSLADVFRLEYQASVGCCVHHDFAEGVRALLVDKDRNPRWQPATLAEVDDAWIAAHLQARHEGPHPLADLA